MTSLLTISMDTPVAKPTNKMVALCCQFYFDNPHPTFRKAIQMTWIDNLTKTYGEVNQCPHSGDQKQDIFSLS